MLGKMSCQTFWLSYAFICIAVFFALLLPLLATLMSRSPFCLTCSVLATLMTSDGLQDGAPASQTQYNKRVALAQMFPMLDGEAAADPAAADPAAAGAPAAAVPLKEPGFVIATTDDSSPPPVTEGTTFHHIKNFAGTEQVNFHEGATSTSCSLGYVVNV